jgi:hypothetical protein
LFETKNCYMNKIHYIIIICCRLTIEIEFS